MQRVFYSWQSDLANRTNRGFIADCLELAIKNLRLDDAVDLCPVMDRDTAGVSGSPEIAQTIFSKIHESRIFVADVSIINSVDNGSRPTPNPNVLIELGYAAGALGWESVLCIFNTAYADIDSLPFDLKTRRIITYSLGANDDKAAAKKTLAGQFKHQMEVMLTDRKTDDVRVEFFRTAQTLLGNVILCCDELESRKLGDHLERIRGEFGWIAKELEKLAVVQLSDVEQLIEEIERLAEVLFAIQDFRSSIGRDSWAEHRALFNEAETIAKSVYSSHVMPQLGPETSKAECIERLRQYLARIEKMQPKIEEKIMRGNEGDVFGVTSEIGMGILWLGLKGVKGLSDEQLAALCETGRHFHVADTISTKNAMKALPKIEAQIANTLECLRDFLSSIS